MRKVNRFGPHFCQFQYLIAKQEDGSFVMRAIVDRAFGSTALLAVTCGKLSMNVNLRTAAEHVFKSELSLGHMETCFDKQALDHVFRNYFNGRLFEDFYIEPLNGLASDQQFFCVARNNPDGIMVTIYKQFSYREARSFLKKAYVDQNSKTIRTTNRLASAWHMLAILIAEFLSGAN